MQRRSAEKRLSEAACQNRLADYLRRLSEERALGLIIRLSAIEPSAALALSNRILRSAAALESLLRVGLPRSNESTCRFWLDAVGRRLGIDRTIRTIEAIDDPNRTIASRSLYWLPSIFRFDPLARDKIRLLERRATPIQLQPDRSFLVSNWSNAA
jgi:hypothetical protein